VDDLCVWVGWVDDVWGGGLASSVRERDGGRETRDTEMKRERRRERKGEGDEEREGEGGREVGKGAEGEKRVGEKREGEGGREREREGDGGRETKRSVYQMWPMLWHGEYGERPFSGSARR